MLRLQQQHHRCSCFSSASCTDFLHILILLVLLVRFIVLVSRSRPCPYLHEPEIIFRYRVVTSLSSEFLWGRGGRQMRTHANQVVRRHMPASNTYIHAHSHGSACARSLCRSFSKFMIHTGHVCSCDVVAFSHLHIPAPNIPHALSCWNTSA